MIYKIPRGRAASNLLLLDIGNSTTHCGIWSHGDMRASERIERDQEALLQDCVAEYWRALDRDRACIICTVADARLRRIRPWLEALTGQPAVVVGFDIGCPIAIAISDAATIGMDRLCNAAAAHQIEGRACAVADFGTALTVDCVNDNGEFIGGAILPGLGLQAKALAMATEKVPEVPIALPAAALGQNTIGAVQAGIVLGSVGAVRELVERFATHLGRWPSLYITGGHAELISRAGDLFDRVVPDLCLRGTALAYYKAFQTEAPDQDLS